MPTSDLVLDEPGGPAIPVLSGIQGWVEGERYVLKDGDAVVIGRSRECDISMRRITGYLERPPGDRDNDHDFNTVSRKHVRIKVKGTAITIEDLSSNGTYCDNQVLRKEMTHDLAKGPLRLRLGTRETFSLELKTTAQLKHESSARQARKKATPPPEPTGATP